MHPLSNGDGNPLGRDKKRGLVLLTDDGPAWDVQVEDEDVRRALDWLIAD